MKDERNKGKIAKALMAGHTIEQRDRPKGSIQCHFKMIDGEVKHKSKRRDTYSTYTAGLNIWITEYNKYKNKTAECYYSIVDTGLYKIY